MDKASRLFGKSVRDILCFMHRSGQKAVLVLYTDGSIQIVEEGEALEILLKEFDLDVACDVNLIIELLYNTAASYRNALVGLLENPNNETNYEKALKLCQKLP